jgi:hypothetical protein
MSCDNMDSLQSLFILHTTLLVSTIANKNGGAFLVFQKLLYYVDKASNQIFNQKPICRSVHGFLKTLIPG